MKKKKLLSVLVAAALSCSLFAAVPVVSQAADTTGVTMYRLYNPNSGEHFYTKDASEKNGLVKAGWSDEGEGWTAPEKSNTPVYRLYNPNSGEHHYTTNAGERNSLIGIGWNDEGIGWYSDDSRSVPLYRLYNPHASGQYEAGAHHYTKDTNERNTLVTAGWQDEGIGWYGVDGSSQKPSEILTVDKASVEIDLYSNPVAYVHVSYAKGVSFSGLISDVTVVDIERINETDTGCDIKITGKKVGNSTLSLLSSGDYSGPQDIKDIKVSVKDSTPQSEKPSGTLKVDRTFAQLDLYSDPVVYVHVSYEKGVSFEGLINGDPVVNVERLNETETDCDLKITGKSVGECTLLLMSSGDYSGPQDHKTIAITVINSKSDTPLTNILSVDKDHVEFDLKNKTTETVLIKNKVGSKMFCKIADPSIVYCNWGEWDENKEIELYITPWSVGSIGSTKITISNDYNNETVVINVTVIDTTFSIETPSTPQPVTYFRGGRLKTSFSINNVEVEEKAFSSGCSATIRVTGVVDGSYWGAEEDNYQSIIGWKLYNEDESYYCTDSFIVDAVNEGETFIKELNFNNLPYGKYRFEIIGKN